MGWQRTTCSRARTGPQAGAARSAALINKRQIRQGATDGQLTAGPQAGSWNFNRHRRAIPAEIGTDMTHRCAIHVPVEGHIPGCSRQASRVTTRSPPRLVAVQRAILTVVWQILTTGAPYQDRAMTSTPAGVQDRSSPKQCTRSERPASSHLHESKHRRLDQNVHIESGMPRCARESVTCRRLWLAATQPLRAEVSTGRRGALDAVAAGRIRGSDRPGHEPQSAVSLVNSAVAACWTASAGPAIAAAFPPPTPAVPRLPRAVSKSSTAFCSASTSVL